MCDGVTVYAMGLNYGTRTPVVLETCFLTGKRAGRAEIFSHEMNILESKEIFVIRRCGTDLTDTSMVIFNAYTYNFLEEMYTLISRRTPIRECNWLFYFLNMLAFVALSLESAWRSWCGPCDGRTSPNPAGP